MPRRTRHSKARRSVDGLSVLIAYSAVSRWGCTHIPEDVTLNDLEWVWTLCGQPKDCWGWYAFGDRTAKPCTRLQGIPDPFDGEVEWPPTCTQAGARCAFRDVTGDAESPPDVRRPPATDRRDAPQPKTPDSESTHGSEPNVA